jgi:hypothetical protein
MEYMGILKNEKGVTLVEVLSSITLLSIVLITIMNIFPQMGLMNQHNQDKTQAISTAKELLIQWQGDSRVKKLFDGSTLSSIPEYEGIDPIDGYYTFKTNGGKVVIKIEPTSSVHSDNINLHQIVIQILGKNENVVSKTYGYVKE